MRSSYKRVVAALSAACVVSLGGCPWVNQPALEQGDAATGGETGGEDGTTPGEGGGETPGAGGGQPPGGDQVVKVLPSVPAKSIGFDLLAIHDPTSDQYDGNCIGCHGERTNEVALDGVTPAAHSVMQFQFLGQGNERCVSCHRKPPDFLSYSSGGLRELVNVERDLAAESSCTSCHSGGGNLAFYVRPPF